ncbi:hypothetical protein [Halomonas salipaludis]|uniref:hypothetical protein n=1 Tax=Halomonas salipaludis TaxID=2032625 RepID=UPI0015961663|nr:hypothetical protein [Halomonas salipaludis]
MMNDSAFGLTAAVFTNCCDYLDSELAWTGVKQLGRIRELTVRWILNFMQQAR